MRKTTFILFVLCLGFTACKKESETGTSSDTNLKVTATIPSSGFHFENTLVITAINSSNTNVLNQKTVSNGGTANFNLNVGHYYVYIDAASNSSGYDPVHSNYGSKNANYSQEVDIAAQSISTLDFTQWCQGDTSGTFYCN